MGRRSVAALMGKRGELDLKGTARPGGPDNAPKKVGRAEQCAKPVKPHWDWRVPLDGSIYRGSWMRRKWKGRVCSVRFSSIGTGAFALHVTQGVQSGLESGVCQRLLCLRFRLGGASS